METPAAAIDRMLRLVEIEQAAEVEETSRALATLSGRELEARGLSLLRLRIVEEETGLGGRILLGLERTTGEPLPPTQIQPGDIVQLVGSLEAPSSGRGGGGPGRGRREGHTGPARPGADRPPSGVVWRKRDRRITVAFDDLPEDGVGDGALRLDRVANDVTYRRMRRALERLRAADRGRPAQLRDILLADREPRFDAPRPVEPLRAGLNEPQVEAVRFALSARDVALVHGPPGTGKTTAVGEIIRQAVRRREKVLACAPSNMAVDNLTEVLSREGVRVVRIGHPARMLPTVADVSLDALVAEHPRTQVARDLRREAAKTLKRLSRTEDWAERRALRDELRGLRKEISATEDAAVREVIDGAEVVLATCTGADDPVLDDRLFALVVLDEAAQALEPLSWIPILKGDRVVLAGDHRQLPPTVISREAARDGLAVTMFDRLMGRGGGRWSRILTIQYRMHRAIMEHPSEELYEGRLEAAPEVAAHLLSGLEGVREAPATTEPVWFVDTSGCGYGEEEEAGGDSRENPLEAEAVARHVEALITLGVAPSAIGVITPYSAQVRLLRERLSATAPALEVDTVDGFQGREKEAMVISLVRSNDRGEVGFLSDVRRINVAFTRARRHLAVFGDGATVGRDPFIRRWIERCAATGAHRSAWELGLGDLRAGGP